MDERSDAKQEFESRVIDAWLDIDGQVGLPFSSMRVRRIETDPDGGEFQFEYDDEAPNGNTLTL